MAANLEPLLTIADLETMPEDGNTYEIIEGELFVSRAPGLTHQRILRNILVTFGSYLRQNPVGEVIPGPGVVFSDFSGVIPDAVYVSNDRREEIAAGERITGAPDLVIEILSPGTESDRRDRHAKRQLYRKYGVREYWVIDPQKSRIEVYRTARLRLVSTLKPGDRLRSPLLPGFECLAGNILG